VQGEAGARPDVSRRVRWGARWRDTLDAGPDQVLTVLVSETPQAAEMRQNSPFTGILPPDERRAVLDSFRQHWRAGHLQ
jgi:hypothetical protein